MTSAELRELFADPPSTFGPTPLWWWSGAEVTSERMRWQLRKLAAGGILNLVVINLAPAGPIFAAKADAPAWFSEEWWDRFTETCELAGELGMSIWFYDQIGFSGANLQGGITHTHPEAAGQRLCSRSSVVTAGGLELVGQEVLVAAYTDPAGSGRGTRVDLSALPPDGTPVQLVAAVPTAYDYLSPAAVELLIDRVHREYDRRVPEHLGNVIAGSFQDELPAMGTWTPAFAEEFRARRGYDLLDHLPALWQGQDDDALKVRGDYGSVRAELAEEALFRPLAEWHAERGLLLGCDQFNPARAGFPTQSTQLYADYFRTHRWYSAAGSDHEGDARVHSSMAHLYGHPRVWVESFHSSGWGGTLEDVYDWLLPFLRSGGNLYNPHATYFGTAGGWFEWAPPSTDWRQPYWQHYPQFSRTVARLCSLLSWGAHSADIAVLHPTATAQALLPLDTPVDHFGDGQVGGALGAVDQTQDHYLQLCGTNNWFDTRVGLLDAAGLAFDVVDDDSLQRSTPATDTAGPGLVVRDHCFRTVVLPSTDVLETATAERLCELLDAGGRVVVVGRAPRVAAGRDGDDAAVRRLVEHPALQCVVEPADVVAILARTDQHVQGDVPLLVRRSGADGLAFVTGAFPNASRYPLRGDQWMWDDYDFDPARYAATQTVTVQAPVGSAEIWNPATGSQRAVPVVRSGLVSRIEVPLEGAPAALLVWHEGEPVDQGDDVPVADAGPVGVPTDLQTGWTGELVPTLDNTWGDLALPPDSALTELQVWTLEWTEDEDPTWLPVKVTSGQQVAVLSPVPAEQRPAPLDRTAADEVRAGQQTLLGPGFVAHTWSGSRGRVKDGGVLGTKGMIAEEFLRIPAPAAGEVAVLRGLVRAEQAGTADLVVGAAAARRVWWNGVEVPAGEGYLS
ncbi:MAG: glycosyl hydrolase, partial [Janthinobacterium lividum]